MLALIAENNKNACRLEISEDTLEVIRAVLKTAESEIDELKLENEALKAKYEECAEFIDAATIEHVDTESMRKDAERYRWLCNGHGYFMEEEMLCHITDEKPAADLAIDTRMLEEAGQ